MAAVLALWGAQTRVKRMREEAKQKQEAQRKAAIAARIAAIEEYERSKLKPWKPGGRQRTRTELVPIVADLRSEEDKAQEAVQELVKKRTREARARNRQISDDIFFDSRRRPKMQPIVALSDGFPEPTGLPPVPAWVGAHRLKVRQERDNATANTVVWRDHNGVRHDVPANPKAKDPFYVRIKNRAKKSAYALGDNEVLVPKRHFRARQVAEDRDKWTALFQLHHYLSHLQEIMARKAARPRHHRTFRRKRRRRSRKLQPGAAKRSASAPGLGANGDSSSSDSEEDDAAYSKLSALTAKAHYLSRLYECLYRACPVFIIRKHRFVAALRSFAMAQRPDSDIDVVTMDVDSALIVKLSARVASAFGVGPDEEMDWRAVLCSLRMVAFPRQTALQHLRWFFLCFASGGVLVPSASIPALPQQRIMAEYDARVAAAKKQAIAKELELQKLHLEQVRVTPKPVPFPTMSLTQRLPNKSDAYPPRVVVPTETIPTIIGLLCGTEVERHAAEEMAATMMAHPYFANPEQEAADAKLPYKERLKKFEDDLFHDTSLSGVSLLQRLKSKPGGLFYRKHVTLFAFDDMLMRDPIGKMLLPWKRESDEDAGSAFETLYHPVLRDYIAEMRKVERVSDIVRRAAQRWRHVKKVTVMDKWVFVTKARKLCRYRLTRVNELCIKSLKAKGLLGWRWFIVSRFAAVRIQSLRRGVVARRTAHDIRTQHRASVLINSHLKRYAGQLWMRRTQEKRRKAATDIQRSWRGRKGRIAARRQLAKFYRREVAKLRHEQRAYERFVKGRAALHIQRVARGWLGRRRAASARALAEEIARKEKEMADWARDEERKERLAVEKARLDAEAEVARKKRAAEDKRQAQRVNAVAMRRQLQQSRAAIKRRSDETTEKIKDRLRGIKAKYKAMSSEIREDVRMEMHYLIQMTFNSDMNTLWKEYQKSVADADDVQLVDPDKLTGEEKQRQKKLFSQITKGAKRLAADVKANTGMTMGADVARVDTFKSLIVNEVKARMQAVKAQKQQEMALFDEWRQQMRNADEREAEGIIGSYKRKAAIMLQRAWRHYRGWKGLLKLVRESFVRHFDEASGTYYYENLRTGETQWNKPKILKNQEVDVYVKPPTPPPATVATTETVEEPAPLTYTQFWMQQASQRDSHQEGGSGHGSHYDDGSGYGHDSHYDDGLGYGAGSHYDDGSGYGHGSHYDDGSGYGAGSHYDDGSGYGAGSHYDDGSGYGDGSHYDDGSGYGDGSHYDDGSGYGYEGGHQ